MKTTPLAAAFALCATVLASPAARALEAGWTSIEIASVPAGAPLSSRVAARAESGAAPPARAPAA